MKVVKQDMFWCARHRLCRLCWLLLISRVEHASILCLGSFSCVLFLQPCSIASVLLTVALCCFVQTWYGPMVELLRLDSVQ